MPLSGWVRSCGLDESIKLRALGGDAFERGQLITSNPYPANTLAHQSWHEGFCAHRDHAYKNLRRP
jgi:hypothetical protein